MLHLHRYLIRSKLDYGCVVYVSARSFYLQILDPIQNHALRLCLGAYTALLLHPVYAWKQMSPLSLSGGKSFYSSIA